VTTVWPTLRTVMFHEPISEETWVVLPVDLKHIPAYCCSYGEHSLNEVGLAAWWFAKSTPLRIGAGKRAIPLKVYGFRPVYHPRQITSALSCIRSTSQVSATSNRRSHESGIHLATILFRKTLKV